MRLTPLPLVILLASLSTAGLGCATVSDDDAEDTAAAVSAAELTKAKATMRALLTGRATGLVSARVGFLDARGEIVPEVPRDGDGLPVSSLEVIALSRSSSASEAELYLFRGTSVLYLADIRSGAVVEASPDLGDQEATDAFAESARGAAATVMAGDVSGGGTAYASLRPLGIRDGVARGLADLGRKLVSLFHKAPAETVEAIVRDLASPDADVALRASRDYVRVVTGSEEGRVAIRARNIDAARGLEPSGFRVLEGDLARLRALEIPTLVVGRSVDDALQGLAAVRARSLSVRMDVTWFDGAALDPQVERILGIVAAEARASGKELRFHAMVFDPRRLEALAQAFPEAKVTLVVGRSADVDHVARAALPRSVDAVVVAPPADSVYVVSELSDVAVLNHFDTFVSALHSPRVGKIYATPRGAQSYRDVDAQVSASIAELGARANLTPDERQTLMAHREVQSLYLEWTIPRMTVR